MSFAIEDAQAASNLTAMPFSAAVDVPCLLLSSQFYLLISFLMSLHCFASLAKLDLLGSLHCLRCSCRSVAGLQNCLEFSCEADLLGCWKESLLQ